MEEISIKEIEARYYEGYLWMSDAEEPQIVENAIVTLPDEGANPFVVEGQLYDNAGGISYSIKYVDGQYVIKKYIVTENDKKNPNEIKTYLSNRMGDRWLRFLRYWEKDTNTDPYEWPVLTQTKNVFIGFCKKEDTV